MPTYDYRKKSDATGCPHCANSFEAVHRMSDEALTVCPKCGGPIERVISAPAIGRSNKALLSDKNLKAHGFQKLVREGKGHYRRTTI